MQIETGTHEDLAPIRALLADAELPTDDVDNGLIKHFIVLRRGTDVVAGGAVVPLGARLGLVRSVVVRPSERGSGFGIRMLSALEERARERGMNGVYLLTTTAAGFFGSLGYTPTERDDAPLEVRETTQFADLCPASASLMFKEL